ncbi:prolyl oligopeptidase family serine peptidase [Arenibacter sp. F26102]|uniref:dienelactone hydrolase family protein n=1 Tax=Arenibacter sp. F26102 TaxID=2926416 RepID=UPI001FF1C4EE|nr:alpha/beta hydrolase family protein [Arenibacter sp. F26102]MCK0146508.1 prolyl oligopeptidase family serine peptidase [Arenibacter sp. F26102]
MIQRRNFIKTGIAGTTSMALGSILPASCKSETSSNAAQKIKVDLPRPITAMTEEYLGIKPLNLYGGYEEMMQKMRSYRPLDLNAVEWRKANPNKDYSEWARQARERLLSGLHYNLPPVNLQAQTLETVETDSFIREKIEFNSTPWFRVPGYFYIPKNVPLPAPALIVMHAWGGPMLFGADRICGEPVHPAIVNHRAETSSGRPLADWYASKGYAVIVIDAFHFGNRAPRGINGLPNSYDPSKLDNDTHLDYESRANGALHYGIRELNWAGTTWAGINYGDDSRCVDYLLSRKEVDDNRIGCTGLSGGGWRTNMIAALEPRVKATVTVGWMTTSDSQQAYNVNGAVNTFCMLPGVWDRIDIPDMISMASPKACMVVSGTEDILFPPVGKMEAARQISETYLWAGNPTLFRNYTPAKPHCYDQEIQEEALIWFNKHLKK